jgi:hypothetical protein
MPIVAPDDDQPPSPKSSVVQIAKPEYKGVTVDTKVEPVQNILSHVGGSSWTVNYYSQALDLDSATQGQGQGTSPVHQQYRLIKGMELKVTTALTTSQNPDTNGMLVTGEANVYPFVIPNIGDMFLADVGAGREGVFEVTNVTRLSVFKQSVHSIEYKMMGYSDTVVESGGSKVNDLNRKVVQTFQYDKDFIKFGQNPLIFEDDYEHIEYLRRNYKMILDRYFKTFISKELGTVILPGQDSPTYDHYITRLLNSIFSAWDTKEVQNLKVLNVDDDYALQATSVWDALLKRDRLGMADVFLKVGKVYAYEFTTDPMLEGVHWSGVNELIYPTDPTLTVDYKSMEPLKLVNGNSIQKGPSRLSASALLPEPIPLYETIIQALDGYNLLDEEGNLVYEPIILPPIIHRTMKDNFYVFSEDFYKNNRIVGKQSQLELMVQDYLDDKVLSFKRLKSFCEDMANWNTLDRFYYTPVLLMLMKAAIRGL